MEKPLKIEGRAKEDTSSQPSLIKALLEQQTRIDPDKSELLESLSKSFQVINFSLGDSINTDPGAIGAIENSENFYLICQGRVRLLGQSDKRSLSVGTLAEGDIFGSDSLFIKDVLAYLPIAASQVTVARLSRRILSESLDKLPELQQVWHSKIKHTQALIFFKTLTDCQSEPSAKISNFLPYLQEKSLVAGEALNRLPKGRYWLRQGRIEGMKVGDSWDDTISPPLAKVTATDVLLYYLPPETREKNGIIQEKRLKSWLIPQLSPMLFPYVLRSSKIPLWSFPNP
jgi:CRP-like cAMP-binding protein